MALALINFELLFIILNYYFGVSFFFFFSFSFQQVDYEVELAFVIGKKGKDIPVSGGGKQNGMMNNTFNVCRIINKFCY